MLKFHEQHRPRFGMNRVLNMNHFFSWGREGFWAKVVELMLKQFQ